MSDDIVERAEEVLEGVVTPEPWEVRDGFVYPLSIRCGLGGIWEQDARFIAAARTLVPELLAALKATPDRTFTDDLGRRWEWCGGVEGTWAWQLTRMHHD